MLKVRVRVRVRVNVKIRVRVHVKVRVRVNVKFRVRINVRIRVKVRVHVKIRASTFMIETEDAFPDRPRLGELLRLPVSVGDGLNEGFPERNLLRLLLLLDLSEGLRRIEEEGWPLPP